MDWRTRAACQRVDPELFFPVGTIAVEDQIRRAQAVCARCEVIAACLAWVLSNGEEEGVWGGLSEADRRGLRRQAASVRYRADR